MASCLAAADVRDGMEIKQPGLYRLDETVRLRPGASLTVAVSNVSLDLGGHTVFGQVLVRKGVQKVRIFDGALAGGDVTLTLQAGCASVRLQGLHIYGFSHTGLHIRSGSEVDVISCQVGPPASWLPFGSVLGIAALPADGLAGMDQLLEEKATTGRLPSSAPRGVGRGLRFHRTAVNLQRPSAYTPGDGASLPEADARLPAPPATCCVAPLGFSAAPKTPARARPLPPCTTDTGVRINVSSCESTRDPWALPTASPGRLAALRGAAQQQQDPASSTLAGAQQPFASTPSDRSTLMTHLGAHGLVLGGWEGTVGAFTELSVAMDGDYGDAIPRTAAASTAGRRRRWGVSSARLVLTLDLSTTDPDAPGPYDDELTKVPLSIKYVRVQQSSNAPGSWVPGARGSYVLC